MSIAVYRTQTMTLMETAELLKRVRRLEIKTKTLSNNIFAGEYHAAFKGRGMLFAEVREYQPGDDVRDIDWNVTARMNRPYIKVFEEERELTVMLLVDVSASGWFGTKNRTVRELAAEIAATLAFSAMQNNDKVGAILFSDRIEKFIPPAKGKRHILRIVRELLDFEPQGKRTDVARAMEYFMRVMSKRTIAFMLSDFFDTHNFDKPLSVAARKHDFIGLRLYDDRMAEMPNVGLVRVADAETGHEQYVDTANRRTREHHRRWWHESEIHLEELFKRCGAGYAAINTESDFVIPLINLFARRS